MVLEARAGSFDVRKNGAKEEIAVISGKAIRGNTNSRIDLEKWYVRTSDCVAKQGKVVTLTLDGEFKFDSDFIFDAGSIASGKAEFICSVFEYSKAEKRSKSL